MKRTLYIALIAVVIILAFPYYAIIGAGIAWVFLQIAQWPVTPYVLAFAAIVFGITQIGK